MKNPIEKRLQTEIFKRLAETFLGRKNFSWWAIFYASLIFIVTGWLPDGIAELLRKEWIEGGYKIAVSLTILIFIGFRLKKAIKYEGKIEVKSEPPPHVKLLAIFLSPLHRELKADDIQKALADGTFSIGDLTKTEWEMPVKAVEYHSQTLKKLYVLTSKQTRDLINVFRSVMKRLFPSVEVVELKPEGIEFQDIEEVFKAVEALYKIAKEEEGFKEDDVIVDVTGGQVPNSIAGAIATLAIGRKFQYVSTRDKEVLSYDIGYFNEG